MGSTVTHKATFGVVESVKVRDSLKTMEICTATTIQSSQCLKGLRRDEKVFENKQLDPVFMYLLPSFCYSFYRIRGI